MEGEKEREREIKREREGGREKERERERGRERERERERERDTGRVKYLLCSQYQAIVVLFVEMIFKTYLVFITDFERHCLLYIPFCRGNCFSLTSRHQSGN